MKRIDPYLNFNGDAEEAFLFYKSVFGGEFITHQRFKDMEGAEKLDECDQGKTMHIALPVKGNILMASDMLESKGQKFVPGNNFAIFIKADSEEEVNDYFNSLSIRGFANMPVEKTFWGSYFGMCTDRFGVQWMISYDYQ